MHFFAKSLGRVPFPLYPSLFPSFFSPTSPPHLSLSLSLYHLHLCLSTYLSLGSDESRLFICNALSSSYPSGANFHPKLPSPAGLASQAFQAALEEIYIAIDTVPHNFSKLWGGETLHTNKVQVSLSGDRVTPSLHLHTPRRRLPQHRRPGRK